MNDQDRAAALESGVSGTTATAKRGRFFSTAEPLFERFGYRKTTIEDVCRAAGMSKRTFYELFKDTHSNSRKA